MRVIKLKLIFALLVFLPATAMAKNYKEGVEYTKLAQEQTTQNSEKIEVLEFFWYGCPHCFAFEPTLDQWLKKLPDNVNFIRVPAPLNPKWMVHTKTYYTLEIMGLGEKYHDKIFSAIHTDKKKLHNVGAVTDFLVQLGVDKKVFTDTFSSFAVEMRARKAMQLAKAYKLNSVPFLAVNGKYTISGKQAGDFSEMIKITEFLIQKEAANKK